MYLLTASNLLPWHPSMSLNVVVHAISVDRHENVQCQSISWSSWKCRQWNICQLPLPSLNTYYIYSMLWDGVVPKRTFWIRTNSGLSLIATYGARPLDWYKKFYDLSLLRCYPICTCTASASAWRSSPLPVSWCWQEMRLAGKQSRWGPEGVPKEKATSHWLHIAKHKTISSCHVQPPVLVISVKDAHAKSFIVPKHSHIFTICSFSQNTLTPTTCGRSHRLGFCSLLLRRGRGARAPSPPRRIRHWISTTTITTIYTHMDMVRVPLVLGSAWCTIVMNIIVGYRCCCQRAVLTREEMTK